MNIVEENREPVNERGIYITKEEDNNEVDNNEMKDNEDNNITNWTNDGISAAEENYLGKNILRSEERNQSDEN